MKSNNNQNLKQITEAFKKLNLYESEESENNDDQSKNESENYELSSINSSNYDPQSILQAKFENSNNIKSKVLKPQNINTQNLKKIERPSSNSSKNITRPKEAFVLREKSFSKNNTKVNFELERPKTSYKGKENVSFQPVYTESYSKFLITNKCFNYKDKKFTTVPKKTDIVSKFQNLKKGWEKTKFLKNNSITGKEGRKLNLAERINSDRPEEIFYRYVPKSGLY